MNPRSSPWNRTLAIDRDLTSHELQTDECSLGILLPTTDTSPERFALWRILRRAHTCLILSYKTDKKTMSVLTLR